MTELEWKAVRKKLLEGMNKVLVRLGIVVPTVEAKRPLTYSQLIRRK